MTPKRIILFMLLLTCVITTIQILWISLIHSYMYASCTPPAWLTFRSLYRFVLIALLSTLPTLIFIDADQASKKSWTKRMMIHFILTLGIVVIGVDINFGHWLGVNDFFRRLLAGDHNIILIPFSLIYIGAISIFNYQQKVLSAKMTSQLQMFYDE